MSVLKGEGKVPILYGTSALPVGRSRPAYIARPDLAGTHPTVVVVHGAGGLSSHVRAVCRRLARYGFAAICPDLFGGAIPDDPAAVYSSNAAKAAVRDAVDTAERPGTPWASGDRIGLLALDAAGEMAVAVANVDESFDAVGLVAPPLDGVTEGLAVCPIPVLAVFAEGDDGAPVEEVRALGDATDGTEIVIYGGLGAEFLDEGAADYDRPAAEDAQDRLVGFFESHLAAVSVD